MSNKKIWSIPIAALAVMLMLAAALVTTGIVRAQTPPGFEDTNPNVAVNGDTATSGTLITLTMEDEPVDTNDAETWGLVPWIVGDSNASPPVTEVASPAIIDSPEFDLDGAGSETTKGDLFTVTQRGAGTAENHLFDIGLTASASSVEVLRAALKQKSSYDLTVKVVIDANTTVDSDNPVDGDVDNDRDYTLTAKVKVYVLGIEDDDLQFDVVASKAVKGATLSGIRNPIASSPLQWEVTGVGSTMKLVGDPVVTDTTLAESVTVEETETGSNIFRLIVDKNGVGDITGAASNLQPHQSGAQTISVTLTYDEDVDVDSDGSSGNTTKKDENADATVTLTGDIQLRNGLGFAGTEGEDSTNVAGTQGDPDDDGYHYIFYVQQAIADGVPFGAFDIVGEIEENAAWDHDNDNATPVRTIAGEHLDGILSGDNAPPFGVDDSDMTIYRKNGENLKVQDYVFDLTVNGDAGMANRAIRAKVKVVVTASNQGHTVPASFSADINENVKATADVIDDIATVNVDETAGGLVSAGTVVGDASGETTDDTSDDVDPKDGDKLEYSLDAAGLKAFKIDSKTGMITVKDAGIKNTGGGPTDTDDDAKYTREDGGKLADDTDMYSDITYKFNIKVSDGVSANDKTIPATVMLDVNDPVKAKSTGLPTEPAVTHMAPAPTATPVVKYDTYTFKVDDVAATANNVVLVNVGELVNAGDGDAAGDEVLKYNDDAIGAGDPLLVRDNGDLVLTHVPRSVEDKLTGSWEFAVSIDDGYNRENNDQVLKDGAPQDPPVYTDDVTIIIKVTVNVKPKPDEETPSLSKRVDEGYTGPVLGALTTLGADYPDNAALGRLIAAVNEVESPDKVTFAHTGGTNNGRPVASGSTATADFSVSETTGEVTLVTAQDYETDGARHTLHIKVERHSDRATLGLIVLEVEVKDVNETPSFTPATATAFVLENADVGDLVKVDSMATAADFVVMATDPDPSDTLMYSLDHDNFKLNSANRIEVTGTLDADAAGSGTYTLNIGVKDRATDTEADATLVVTVNVGNTNDEPTFTSPTGDGAVVRIPEGTKGSILKFTAEDKDKDNLTFDIREGVSRTLFYIGGESGADGVFSGNLMVLEDAKGNSVLDYEHRDYVPDTGYLVNIQVSDGKGGSSLLRVTVNLTDVNDESPMFSTDETVTVHIAENEPRGKPLVSPIAQTGVYTATDRDGTKPNMEVRYLLQGNDAKSFQIDKDTGRLTTLESLDKDSNNPCAGSGCLIDIVAYDGPDDGLQDTDNTDRLNIKVIVTDAEDSVSSFTISKANPLPGTTYGNAMSALADGKTGEDEYLWNKLDCAGMLELVGEDPAEAISEPPTKAKAMYCKMWDGLGSSAKTKISAAFDGMNPPMSAPAESPYDLPATEGSAPHNFVTAEWGSWDTVLRIEVTAESPDSKCGNGNQCVYVDVEADSSDDKLRLIAYRSGKQENRFITAVKLVENNPTYGEALVPSTATADEKKAIRPVYMDDVRSIKADGSVNVAGDGMVARLETDEEDEIEIRLASRGDVAPISLEVENEAPEFNNFMPEHESAFDDGDVDYTFTITDTVSGIPDPEDLPDTNGDGDYMPLVALVSSTPCWTTDPTKVDAKKYKSYNSVPDHITAGNDLYCTSDPSIRQITDDRDFDEIDDGFEVDTKIVLAENKTHFVTFIACDKAGNCELYTPDENNTDEALAQITIDTVAPKLVEARTGVAWDNTDKAYDANRSFVQIVFMDLTALDPTSIEPDDFVVEGHTIKKAHWYDVKDNHADVCWTKGTCDPNSDDRFALEGKNNTTDRGGKLRQQIRNAVFLELEDQLAPDETPDVTLVPNGISDSAGKEQDDGDVEADDWIAPGFTIVVNPTARTPEGSANVLAGEGDEVVINLTSDERIVQTRPNVEVHYVNAPKGKVYSDVDLTKTCKKADGTDGKRVRGEIILNETDKCGASAAKGAKLGSTIEKVSNTEWTVTVKEPDDTGYYNIYVSAEDRSSQQNRGDEGVSPNKIVTKFFDRDGDVNSDDAYYFQGDRNLANPRVHVSGTRIRDTEPDVEFKTPMFVELDFTQNYLDSCDADEAEASCMAEKEEYHKDSFETVTVTSFTLNGVDMTDSVKTTDDKTFLASIDNPSIGDHTIEVQAVDLAGNTLDKTLEIEFEVEERDDFTKRLSPGWNLVSIPGEPADSDISVVFGADVEVRTVYTYNPIIPGGWMVAVRESMDSEWQGDLKEITARQGYWVLSDAIQDWDVSIPRLAGGAVGSGTPIQPPVIALYAGWNLVPIVDVTGDFDSKDAAGVKGISATAYLQSLDEGLDLARVLGFDTITNKWSTIMAPECGACGPSADTLEYGSAYWVFVRQAASLVPGH